MIQDRFASIKPCDIVCVGMWQKHMNQVAAKAAIMREILGWHHRFNGGDHDDDGAGDGA